MTDIKPDTPNAAYEAQADHYQMVGDFYRGVGAVREQKETYLPKTSGMINAQDQSKANERYKAFVGRATFPGILRHTVSSIVGVTTAKEPKEFVVPSSWESIDTNATLDGDPLNSLQGKVVREVAKFGRVGLMTDLRSDDEPVPVLTPFYANQIINWRTAVIDGQVMLTLLVIRKTESVEGENYWDDTTLEVVESFELLPAGVFKRRFEKRPDKDGNSEWVEVPTAQPRSRKQTKSAEATVNEKGRINGFRLMEIPFTPINTQGLSIDPVDPPFLDLVNKLKDIYIGSANYREALSMYEPTPVIVGLTEDWIKLDLIPKYFGAGQLIQLPAGADAKMLEYQGRNIADIRQSLMDDLAEAERLASQPFEKITAAPESGESKKQQSKAKTNVIREIHLATGAGIQEALRKGARWTGENDEKIFYTPTDDLDDIDMSPEAMRELTSSWMSGLIPDRDAYAQLKSGGKTQLTYEEWKTEREGGLTGKLSSDAE